ncbi:MAG: recombinase family protein [Candidatus Poribacteria bacterium]|nr:recombinase family protein [Candidatus Poribacteria bacterium]
MQRDASIEDQVRVCRERAKAESWIVTRTYSDAAISGGSLKTRPGMLDLLRDAGLGQFNIVLSEALDRLSRDQEDIAAIFKRLRFADVDLVTLTEGEIGELHIGLKGTMNALFLKDLAIKTRRGLRGRVEAGYSGGGNSFGYRVRRKLLADGTATTGEREIDHDEAVVIRRIFAEYVAGRTPRCIVANLNADGIAAPRGGQWNASTVNGSRQRRNGILNNELYVGRLVWNRQRFVKDPETGKRLSRPNPKTEWIVSDVPELRIIDGDTWEKTKVLKSRYSSQAGNRRQTKKRLLTGLLKCGICGGNMTIARHDRYYCANKREKGTCNASHGVSAPDAEARVLSGLREILVGNDELLDAFTKSFNEEVRKLQKERQKRTSGIRKELLDVERGVERCINFITSGDGAPDSVRAELHRLEGHKAKLQAQLITHPIASNVVIHPSLPELYHRKVGQLARLLEDEDLRLEAMDAVRSLIDHIGVHPGNKRGECGLTLVGALAGILSFATNKYTTRKGGTNLLVAGVGFEPTTFRL